MTAPNQTDIYNAGKSAGRAEAAADLARLRAERDEAVRLLGEIVTTKCAPACYNLERTARAFFVRIKEQQR